MSPRTFLLFLQDTYAPLAPFVHEIFEALAPLLPAALYAWGLKMKRMSQHSRQTRR